MSIFWTAVISFIISTSPAHTQPKVKDLSHIFQVGQFLSDTNADSLADAVAGYIIIPDTPSQAEIIGASNIAARVGFETTAMNLDIVKYHKEALAEPGRTLIHVKPETLDRKTQLAPGQGIIEINEAGNEVIVSGYDASGLLAASNYFSGQYPLVGDNGDYDFTALKEDLLYAFREDSIRTKNTAIRELMVTRGKKGITAVKVNVTVVDGFTDIDSKKLQKKWKEKLLANGLHRLELIFEHNSRERTVQLKSGKVQPDANYSLEGQEEKELLFDISELYTNNGIYKDTNKDKVPDDSRAFIAYTGKEAPRELAALAARIGLETAGIRLPLVYPANELDPLTSAGFPILVGVESQLDEWISRDSTVKSSDHGWIELKEKLFEDANGLIVTGKGEQELSGALSYLAENIPYVWEYGKGNVMLEEIQTEARRFFQGVDGVGQVANAIEKLDTWTERIADKDISNIQVELAAKETPEGLSTFLRNRIQKKFQSANIDLSINKTGFGVADNIFTEEITIPWEVDDFTNQFNNQVLPELNAQSSGSMVVRLSESSEVRTNIKNEIEQKLQSKGVDLNNFSVHVINAYKQGFSWINEQMLPRLKENAVASMEIRYKHLRDSDEIKWQATDSETRWLQELYPIDGVFMNELGLDSSAITFTPSYDQEETYVLEAFDDDGQSILKESFDPKYIVRPYFDLFPKYDSVRVTTGWMTAEIDGKQVVDRRIKTDLERFWDHMQTSTYQKVLNYVMDIQDGKPDPKLAPYFDELRFEVTMSEPNHQLGILKEQITPLEALHEDIYFETLLFFRLIGNRYGVGALNYPGRILPYMMPPIDGKPGKAKITFTGKREGRPHLSLRYTEQGKETKEFKYELPNINVDEPRLSAIGIDKNAEDVGNIIFNIKIDKEKNPYEKFKQRGSESYVDRSFVSSERLSGMVDALRDLQSQEMFGSSLSYNTVNQISFRFTLEDSVRWAADNTLDQTSSAKATVRQAPLDKSFEYSGQNIVQWESPIPPAENNTILSKLNTFDNINVYYGATSMLGEDVYVMDLLPPTSSKHVSDTKLAALKPTLFISGRQHANEFSSTSHILKLAEKVATDPEYKKYLNKVNLILHPITNPDGAKLAVEMNKVNKYYMHHAGYLGPLGVDITRDQDEKDPRYEVAKVRREVHDEWLPDVYINMHGYPPHEWVQHFAGYSAWMMDRDRGPRSNNYWIPRGYFLTGFSWYDHEDFPSSRDLSFALLDSISTRVNEVPAMQRVNQEMQARYKKYRSQEDSYGEFYRNGVWVNSPLTGRKKLGEGYSDPNVTYFTLTSEAPDEPAHGEWMEMNAAAGLAHSTAALQYLFYGTSEKKQEAKVKKGRTHRINYRIKPVLPKKLYKKYKTDTEN